MMAAHTVNTEDAKALADVFVKDMGTHVDALIMRHDVTPWPDEAHKFVDQASPDSFLAWCWQQRYVLVADHMRRIDRQHQLRHPDALPGGLTPRQEAQREHRTEGARRREAEGLLTGKWNVPGVGPTQLGHMTRENLEAVAGDFRGQAAALVKRARFFERLAKDLRPGQTVAEKFTAEQVKRWWDSIVAVAQP